VPDSSGVSVIASPTTMSAMGKIDPNASLNFSFKFSFIFYSLSRFFGYAKQKQLAPYFAEFFREKSTKCCDRAIFLNKNPPFPRGKASCRIHSSGRVGVKKHKYVFGF
jgi:hypothetical protein